MEVMFRVVYHTKVVKEDISKLGTRARTRIKKAIEAKLMTRPEVFGRPLRRSLKGYRKFRVGDYRIVFRIQGKQVQVFVIAHRSYVYERVHTRI